MMLRNLAALGAMGAVLAGCNLPGAETPTETPSADQVLQTAQAIAEATLAAETPTPTRVPPTDTPAIPTETPTPVLTATPASPVVTADYNVAIRRGPGEDYEAIDIILGGSQGNVVGRYDNSPIGTWWFIERIGEGLNGWVWSGAVTLSGSAVGVPVLALPPTSTPSPEPTSPPQPTATATATP